MLSELDFVRTDTDNMTVFSEAQHDALIVLPQLPPEQQVWEQHLVAVESTLKWKGITSAAHFHALLDQADSTHGSTQPEVTVGNQVLVHRRNGERTEVATQNSGTLKERSRMQPQSRIRKQVKP